MPGASRLEAEVVRVVAVVEVRPLRASSLTRMLSVPRCRAKRMQANLRLTCLAYVR